MTTLGIGLVGGTLYNITLNEGTSLTSASSAALIMATAPVWGMLIAAGFGVEPLKATTLIGAGVSLVGAPAAIGFATYFTILFSIPAATVATVPNWPGRRSMGTRLVARIGLRNRETVWVVAHEQRMSESQKATLAQRRV